MIESRILSVFCLKQLGGGAVIDVTYTVLLLIPLNLIRLIHLKSVYNHGSCVFFLNRGGEWIKAGCC